LKFDNSFSPR